MTARQIRIACCGMVVSTRSYSDDADFTALAREILEDVDTLLEFTKKPVDAWVIEGNVIQIVGRWA